MKMMTLKEALKLRPLILCPFCDWNIPSHTQTIAKATTEWRKHIKEDKCYKEIQ